MVKSGGSEPDDTLQHGGFWEKDGECGFWFSLIFTAI
jgi:hypothetical protein